MKKWIKDWWFSILCFATAVGLSIFVIVGHIFLASDDDFIYALLMINCLSPVLLLLIIGTAAQPKKEKKDD